MSATSRFTSTPAFFEAMYQENGDPWNFSSEPSELRRYDATVAALSHRRYKKAFEPGCSIGVLTERLARLCDSLDAIDFSPTAVAQAQKCCALLPNVRVSCASILEGIPTEGLDLLVLSEIGYYFSCEAWRTLAFSMIDPLREGSTILAVHWLGHSKDHTISGDQVHDILRSHPALTIEHSERHETFRLDRLVKHE